MTQFVRGKKNQSFAHLNYGTAVTISSLGELSVIIHGWPWSPCPGYHCHGVTGCAVSTATGLFNMRWQFSTPPPQNPHPSPITKKCCRWLCRWPYGCAKIGANPSMGALWVKYIQRFKFIYLYVFSGTRLQVRSIDGFSCLTAQTTQTRARVFRWHCSQFFLLMKTSTVALLWIQIDLVYPPNAMTQHNIHASHISSLLRHRKQNGDRSVSKIQEGCFNAEDTGNNFWQLLWHWLPEIQAYG